VSRCSWPTTLILTIAIAGCAVDNTKLPTGGSDAASNSDVYLTSFLETFGSIPAIDCAAGVEMPVTIDGRPMTEVTADEHAQQDAVMRKSSVRCDAPLVGNGEFM
jgi:hypothetical protein